MPGSRPNAAPADYRVPNGTPDSSTQLLTSSAWYVRAYGRVVGLANGPSLPYAGMQAERRESASTVPVNRTRRSCAVTPSV